MRQNKINLIIFCWQSNASSGKKHQYCWSIIIGLRYQWKMPKIALGTTALWFNLFTYSMCVLCTCALNHNYSINSPGPLSTMVTARMIKIQIYWSDMFSNHSWSYKISQEFTVIIHPKWKRGSKKYYTVNFMAVATGNFKFVHTAWPKVFDHFIIPICYCFHFKATGKHRSHHLTGWLQLEAIIQFHRL